MFLLYYCIVFSRFSKSWLAWSKETKELVLLLSTRNIEHIEIHHIRRVKVGKDFGVLILDINQFLEIIRHVIPIRNYFDCQNNVTLITLPEINSPAGSGPWSPITSYPDLDYPLSDVPMTQVPCSRGFMSTPWWRSSAPVLRDNVTPKINR